MREAKAANTDLAPPPGFRHYHAVAISAFPLARDSSTGCHKWAARHSESLCNPRSGNQKSRDRLVS